MNSIFDAKKFYKLIFTPYELELAFREWNNYILYDPQMILNENIKSQQISEIGLSENKNEFKK